MASPFLSTLNHKLNMQYDIEELMLKLKENQSTERKLEIWNRIKIRVFARSLCWIYAASIVVLLISVELALVARLLYLRSIFLRAGIEFALYHEELVHFDRLAKSLVAYTNEFVDMRVAMFSEAILNATTLVLGNVDIQQDLDFTHFTGLMKHVRALLESSEGKDHIINLAFEAMHDANQDICARLIDEIKATLKRYAGKVIMC